MRRPRTVALVAWSLLAVLAVAFAIASPRFAHVDFVAFSCAGKAVASGADPYREKPMNGCERAVTNEGIFATGATVPSPLPPYALVPFAVFAKLPFDAAYLLFTAISLAGLAIAIAVLARMTGAPAAVLAAAFASTGLDNLRKGQPLPLLCCALTVAAWFLSRGRDRLAASAAAFTMIEPHVGIVVCGALFVFRPRARLPLVAAAVVFAAAALMAVKPAVIAAYLQNVLPMHAASEASWVTQLSLTNPLMLFGIGPSEALRLGFLQYLAGAVIGIAIAGRCAKAFGAEAIVVVPVLFAVLGGTFVHQNAMLLALPAAFVLAYRTSTPAAFLGLGLIAIGWLQVSEPVQFVLCTCAGATIAYAVRRRLRDAIAIGIAVAVVGIVHGLLPGAPRKAPPPVPVAATAFAEQSWTELLSEINPPRDAQIVAFAMKALTWSGLLLLTGAAGLSTLPRRDACAGLVARPAHRSGIS